MATGNSFIYDLDQPPPMVLLQLNTVPQHKRYENKELSVGTLKANSKHEFTSVGAIDH